MQIYADVCNRPMKIARSAQTCALGSAIFGAVVGGAYPDVAQAQAVIAGCKDKVYEPNPAAVEIYARLFALYADLHDEFGGVKDGDLGTLMKELIAIREAVRGA
jgi:L-ribulokinase